MLNVCEAMAKWMTFEADLWNIGSLSHAQSFGVKTRLISKTVALNVHRQHCQERPLVRFKHEATNSRVSSSSASRRYTFQMVG